MSLDYWSVWNCTGSYLTNILQTPYGLQMTIDSHKTPELASKYHLPYTVEVFRFVVRAESDDWLRILSVLRDAGVEVDGEYEPQWLLDMQRYADKHAQE